MYKGPSGELNRRERATTLARIRVPEASQRVRRPRSVVAATVTSTPTAGSAQKNMAMPVRAGGRAGACGRVCVCVCGRVCVSVCVGDRELLTTLFRVS